jgi:4-hydroxy-tetrahydrodipicolinate synthase
MTTTTLRGCGTALVTPFQPDGSLDEPALRALIQWQLAAGVHMLIPCGSTGEAVTLAPAEHRRVVEITVEEVNGRVPVIAGAGSNDTQRAIATSREMRSIGATHLLHVTPMYNKPTQRAMLAHFRAIADACDLPIMLYNVPGRTVADMAHETVMKLTQVHGIIGIKEATGNIERAQWLIKEVPKGFSIYSGDDPTAVALMLCGGHGNISVTANVAPRLMHELCVAARNGDVKRAMEIQFRLMPLHKHLFVEPNPIPVKWAMNRMGLCGDAMRLPMTALTTLNQNAVESALVACDLL